MGFSFCCSEFVVHKISWRCCVISGSLVCCFSPYNRFSRNWIKTITKGVQHGTTLKTVEFRITSASHQPIVGNNIITTVESWEPSCLPPCQLAQHKTSKDKWLAYLSALHGTQLSCQDSYFHLEIWKWMLASMLGRLILKSSKIIWQKRTKK